MTFLFKTLKHLPRSQSMGRCHTKWQTSHSMQNSDWARLLQFLSKPNPLLHLPHLSHLHHLNLQVILCYSKLTLKLLIVTKCFFQIQEAATQTLHGVLMMQIMRKKVGQYIGAPFTFLWCHLYIAIASYSGSFPIGLLVGVILLTIGTLCWLVCCICCCCKMLRADNSGEHFLVLCGTF